MSGLSEVERSILREIVNKWDGTFPVGAQEIAESLGLDQSVVQTALQGLIDRQLVSLGNFGDNLIFSVSSPTGEARDLLE